MRIIFIALLVSLVCVPPAARAGDKGKTPEEAFAAAQDAYKKAGPKAFLPFLTRDSQKALAGGMVVSVYGIRTLLASKKVEDLLKDVDALIKKHAIDTSKLKDKSPTSVEAAIAALLEAGGMPKDPVAFVDEAVATLNRISGSPTPIELLPSGAVVKDVKISGETAKGTMHYGDDLTEPVHFRHEAGVWRIDFLPTIRASFGKGKK